jgi:hypothetical protein
MPFVCISLVCTVHPKIYLERNSALTAGNNLAQLLRKYVQDIHWIRQASHFHSSKQSISINTNCQHLTQKYRVHLTHFNLSAIVSTFRTNYGGHHKSKCFKATERVQPPPPHSSKFTMLHCHFYCAHQPNIFLQLKMRSLWQQKIICIHNIQI